MKKKISIIGYTGFIGNYLCHYFAKNYVVKKIKIRNKDIANLSENFYKKIFESDIVINSAASLNPKSKNDLYLNENFPAALAIANKKYKKKFIHFSTINVLVKLRKDKYTISKRKAEKNLIFLKKNITILRLPLVIKTKNKKIQNYGNISSIFNYFKKIKLPIYPMIFPGHIYKPIEISDLGVVIQKIIQNKIKKNILNLSGSKKESLWTLTEKIAKIKNKKIIRINTQPICKLLPVFIINFIASSQSFLQQMLSINHTLTKKNTNS